MSKPYHYNKFKFVESDTCRVCGRDLKDADSMLIGVGPECTKRMGIDRKATIESVQIGNGMLFFEGIDSIDTNVERFTQKLSTQTLVDIDKRLKLNKPDQNAIVKALKDCTEMLESVDFSDAVLSTTRKRRLERNMELMAMSIRANTSDIINSYNGAVNGAVIHADVKRVRKMEDNFKFITGTLSKIIPEDGISFKIGQQLLDNEAFRIPNAIAISYTANGDKRTERATMKVISELASEYSYNQPLETLAARVKHANNRKSDLNEVKEIARTGNVVGIASIDMGKQSLKSILDDSKSKSAFIKNTIPHLQKQLKDGDLESVNEAIKTYGFLGIDRDVLPAVREEIQAVLNENGRDFGTKQKWLYKILKENKVYDLIFRKSA